MKKQNPFKGFSFNSRENNYIAYDCFSDTKGTYAIGDNWKNFIKGHSIVDVKVNGYGDVLTLVLDNGVNLIATSNEGCGGCNNSWFTYVCSNVLTLGLKGNVITNVEVNCDYDEKDEYGTFSLYIYTLDKRLDIDFDGTDNGYYGIGINLSIKIPMNVMYQMCGWTA